EVRTSRPRRAGVGGKGEQGQDAGGGDLVDQEGGKFQRGWIDPVQGFPHKKHGRLGGGGEQERQEGMESLLRLVLGRQGEGSIVGRQGEGEERGKEGHSLCQGQTKLHHESLQFAQLLQRGFLPVKA